MVAGRRTIIVRDVHDVSTVWRNTQALTIDAFVVECLGAFGISKPTLAKIFADPRKVVHEAFSSKSLLIKENPNNKVYMDLERDWFTSQLLAPEALRNLQGKYLRYLHESLRWDNLSSECVVTSHSGYDKSKTVSLQLFCRNIVSYCGTSVFFGKGLLQMAPDFLTHYRNFEKNSWKIFYCLPPFLAHAEHKAKNKAVDGLARFLDMKEQHDGLEWMFRSMTNELRYLGVGNRDIAQFVLVFVWA